MTRGSGRPCSGPTAASDRMPRIVRVIGAHVTDVSTSTAAPRVNTHTGRRPAGGQVPEQVVVAAGGGGAGSNYDQAHGGNGGVAVATGTTARGDGQTGGAQNPGGIPGTGARYQQQAWQGGTGFATSGSDTFGWSGGIGGCTPGVEHATVTVGTLPSIALMSPGFGDNGGTENVNTCEGEGGGGGGGAGTTGGGGGYYADTTNSGGGGGGGSQARDTAGTNVPAFAQ